MTDKELLEMAAKAAGITITWAKWDSNVGPFVNGSGWNPLTYDGDALRLAVELGFQYGVIVQGNIEATRRNIVEAAAEIGRAM